MNDPLLSFRPRDAYQNVHKEPAKYFACVEKQMFI